jgi:hypothetical protein
MRSKFPHGQELRAEEMALHQKFISAMGRLQAAETDDDEREARRLRPVVKRARRRWLKVNKRFARGE